MNLKPVSRPTAAIAIAAAFVLAPDLAHASPLTFGLNVFRSHSGTNYVAATDPITGYAWVSPNIASGDTYANLQTLCPGDTCTGSLAGLTWASDTAVNQFWKDIGVPLDDSGSYWATGLIISPFRPPVPPQPPLDELIGVLGVTHTYSDASGTNVFLAGVSNDAPTAGSPHTPFMRYFYSSLGPAYNNELAVTFAGAENGYGVYPPTGGWFYFTPGEGALTPVPEPGSFGMMGLGLGLLGLGFIWNRKRRNRTMQEMKSGFLNGSFA